MYGTKTGGAIEYAGYLYLQQKMYPEAIEVFKYNVEYFPNCGWAYAHFAAGYSAAGDKTRARNSLEKAIELAPDEKYFKEELRKLEK